MRRECCSSPCSLPGRAPKWMKNPLFSLISKVWKRYGQPLWHRLNQNNSYLLWNAAFNVLLHTLWMRRIMRRECCSSPRLLPGQAPKWMKNLLCSLIGKVWNRHDLTLWQRLNQINGYLLWNAAFNVLFRSLWMTCMMRRECCSSPSPCSLHAGLQNGWKICFLVWLVKFEIGMASPYGTDCTRSTATYSEMFWFILSGWGV